jgi:hypothetical protein
LEKSEYTAWTCVANGSLQLPVMVAESLTSALDCPHPWFGYTSTNPAERSPSDAVTVTRQVKLVADLVQEPPILQVTVGAAAPAKVCGGLAGPPTPAVGESGTPTEADAAAEPFVEESMGRDPAELPVAKCLGGAATGGSIVMGGLTVPTYGTVVGLGGLESFAVDFDPQ